MDKRRSAGWVAFAVAWAVFLSASPPAAAAPGPVPLSTVVPFALPLLEGAQAKVEIGYNGPNGNATSYWGNQPAFVNFSVWWWDSGPPTTSHLVLDGSSYTMTAAPGGDGDDSNGTLFVAKVNLSVLSAGEHRWHFDFAGPSGSVQLPNSSNFTQMRLDTADRFLSDSLRGDANSVVNSYRAGNLKTLRDVVNASLIMINSSMASDWSTTDGYPYSDPNHYIIQPSGATADNLEAFVAASGASKARYSDVAQFPNNSQPAIKQALVLRGVLMATGFFNDSDVTIWTESMVVNGTTYLHPYLRVALRDGSEQPGDGTVNGDGWMDADLWGFDRPTPVPVGSHFGEDYNTADDAPWAGSVGWPPSNDPYASYVLAPYKASFNVTTPDNTTLNFYLFDSHPTAEVTTPRLFNCYWTDDPVVFDGLSSSQSAYLDLSYDWVIQNTVWAGLGPVWLQPIGAIGNYTVTLTVHDAFGHIDTTTIVFCMHGKTKLAAHIGDVVFPEDASPPRQIDLRSFFTDQDGFSTIQFTFASNSSDNITLSRSPSTSPLLTFTTLPNWCGEATATISATDGTSPVIVETFNITVTCVNDPPVLSASLPASVNFTEDTVYTLPALSSYATDVDVGDTLVWSCGDTTTVACVVVAANDTLMITAPKDWNGPDQANLCVTDGSPPVCRPLLIRVLPANDPPYLAHPLPAFVVLEDSPNTTFQLSTYFADPDGDPLSALVTSVTAGLEADYFPVLTEVWFHPAENFSGASSFDLRVRDPYGASVTVRVNVTVTEVNDAPVILTADPAAYARGNEGEKLVFTVTAFDSDSPTLTYAFSLDGEPQGSIFIGSFDWQTGYQSAGLHTLEVNVTDGAGGQATYRWTILIADVDRPPTVTLVRSGGPQYNTGQPITLSADGTDPDGDNLTYMWTFGGAMQPMQGRTINVTFNGEANYTVKVTASDGKLTASDSTVLKVVYVPPVEPPPNNTPPPSRVQSDFVAAPFVLLALAAGAAAYAVLARRRR